MRMGANGNIWLLGLRLLGEKKNQFCSLFADNLTSI